MVAVVALVAALASPRAARADENGHSAIVWVGTVATNLFYIPVKTVHAGLGGLVGGLSWLVTGGNPNAANAVFDHTMYASWYVSPEMLEGKEDLYFFGADD
jgi:hypothetical protein